MVLVSESVVVELLSEIVPVRGWWKVIQHTEPFIPLALIERGRLKTEPVSKDPRAAPSVGLFLGLVNGLLSAE